MILRPFRPAPAHRARLRRATCLAACAFLLPAACSDDGGDARRAADPTPARATPIVAAVNEPLAFFARSIGGDAIDVRFPAPADEDPAFWMPDVETIGVYQDADLVLLNGADYAKWTGIVALPSSRLVDTSRSFADAYIEAPVGVVHSHGPEGEHDHAGRAFTTWIDFDQAGAQARAVHAALVARAPDRAPEFDRALASLLERLEALDRRMLDAGRALAGVPMIASHPVYQYWARRYALDVRAVHWEPDGAPSDAQRDELRALLEERDATVMIWEGVPVEAARRAADDAGLESIVFDPCGGPPAEGEDFLAVMERNVAAIERLAAARAGG